MGPRKPSRKLPDRSPSDSARQRTKNPLDGLDGWPEPQWAAGGSKMMESRQFLHVKSTAAAITSCNFKNFVKDAAVPTVWILGGVLMAVGTLRALKGM